MSRYLSGRYGSGLAPAHIWLGVSVEDRQNAVRIKHLRTTRAAVKFIRSNPCSDLSARSSLQVSIGRLSAVRVAPRRGRWMKSG